MATKKDPKSPFAGGASGAGRFSRLFGRLPGFKVIGRGSGGPPSAREAAELARRVAVPLLSDSPEINEWREIERGFTGLAEEDLWMSLLDRLRGVDQARQKFASGRRYFECALSGTIAQVTRHLGHPARIDAATAALAPLTTLHVANTRDYMPAVLLGQALIEIGWTLRGPKPPRETPRDALAAARSYFARAEAVLESFDPIEENSPMLAQARYRLAPGVEGGEEFLRDWYEDWADLDPSDPQMLASHSRMLTPDWYGDYDEIEREAQRAITRAAEGLGVGAYPCFWRAPLETDPSAVARIDVELFLEGIHTMLAASNSQSLANDCAALLYRLSLPPSTEARDDTIRAEPIRERLAAGFTEVLQRHLTELHGPIWGVEDAAIRRALAQGFEAEFAAGAILRPGAQGIEAVDPADR